LAYTKQFFLLVSYGSDTWFLTLKQGNQLQIFENKVTGKIFIRETEVRVD